MKDTYGNTIRKDNFTQVCVNHGIYLPDDWTEKDFEDYFYELFEVKIQFLEEIKTFPDTDDRGDPIEGTGGRSDIFFAVHDDNLAQITGLRFRTKHRWIEDVLAKDNYTSPIYPERVSRYRTWTWEGEDPLLQ